MLKGIDVSCWQGAIDWSSVSKTQNFAIIRSSYGTGYSDSLFTKNRDAVRSKGMLRGFYHYAYPNLNKPEAEADWFLSVVAPLQANEVLVLDFEEAYPTPVAWCKTFLDRLSANLGGYKPMIYLNKHICQTYDWSPVASKGYGLWLAYWDYNPDGTFSVPHWDVVAMRQYSNQGQVNGVSGRVDLNVFYGDKAQFEAYGVKVGDIPCEKVKQENEALKLEKRSLLTEKAGLVKSLEDLNGLYKKLLSEDVIEDEEFKKALESLKEVTGLYKLETEKYYKLDQNFQTLKTENEALVKDNARLKLQKFTITESLSFLVEAIRGGDK